MGILIVISLVAFCVVIARMAWSLCIAAGRYDDDEPTLL